MGPEEEKKTLVESMQDGSLLESAKDTVTDKKFLGGAGVGFIGGAIAGAGITHMVHKNKQKKEEEEEKRRKKEKKDKKKKKKKRRGSSSSFSSCSSCSSSSSDSDYDSGRYSVGTKVWRKEEGYEYRGKIVNFNSRNNRYYIVWEDGDESEWSEKKVRKNQKKSGSKSKSSPYSVGTKVWTNWAGWEYSGTIVGVNSRYNTYHIVWEDGDESEWSEKKVRRSRMKRGLE